MTHQLTLTDFDWLQRIGAAADDDEALGGVPLGVSARLTGLQLVTWIGQNALTLSKLGRAALTRAALQSVGQRLLRIVPTPGAEESEQGLNKRPARRN